MEENNKKEEMVYIPYGIKNRREFFDGFGVSELKYTLMSLPLTASLAFLLSKSAITFSPLYLYSFRILCILHLLSLNA